MQSAPSEAQRLVFMSWPGQKELDDGVVDTDNVHNEMLNGDTADKPSKAMGPQSIFDVPSSKLATHPSVMPPKAQKEDMQHKMTIRQLG